MDEELWLDYYDGGRDEDEPERDNDESERQDELEREPEQEIEPETDQKIESPQPQQDAPERRRWGYRDCRSRITDRRARVTRRSTPQREPVIYQLPTPSRERRRTSPADQIIMLALLNIKQLRDPDQKKKSIYFGRVYDLKDQDS